ncbi:uncharacterized protein LOC141905276 [Tubulanus polymorphus]|uniref:uncharacterized protein LOC141905276 n=1 Tax=Tubulanus polymorphus TaxID=672921 RepID=UPI003DA481E1
MKKSIVIAVMLLAAALAIHCAKPPRHAKVLILGAGAAGISAAKYLHDHGVNDFIIIDAENHIGGRVKATEFGDKKIELGANWVHGTDGNPLWDLTKKYNLSGIISNQENLMVRDATGNDVTREAFKISAKLMKAIDGAQVLAAFMTQNKMADIPESAALHYGGWPMRRTTLETALETAHLGYGNAATPEMTSVLHYQTMQDNFAHKDFFVTDQRGFGFILEKLADEFLTNRDRQLILNETISKVAYGSSRSGVKVETKTGKIFTGDYAICTFSIGVMQSDAVNFIPRLSPQKQVAFDSFGMGTYTKIFMRFDKKVQRFWDNKEYIVFAHPTKGYYTLWQSLEAEGLHPAGTNMLLATVFGDEADRVSRLSVDTVKAELTAVLRSMYGAQVPEPVEIIVPDWHTNPLYFGTYTNWPPWMSAENHALMSAPLNDKLYFAGEGYSATAFGYVHGAMHSGNQTAKEVLSKINR